MHRRMIIVREAKQEDRLPLYRMLELRITHKLADHAIRFA